MDTGLTPGWARRPPVRQGIVVVSSSSTLLYASEDAQYLLKRLKQDEYGSATEGALPLVIADLIDTMMRKGLEGRPQNGERSRLEAKRLVLGKDRPLLFQVFGLPDRLGRPRSHVVIKIEEIARSVDA